jgi:hypothetical protein
LVFRTMQVVSGTAAEEGSSSECNMCLSCDMLRYARRSRIALLSSSWRLRTGGILPGGEAVPAKRTSAIEAQLPQFGHVCELDADIDVMI